MTRHIVNMSMSNVNILQLYQVCDDHSLSAFLTYRVEMHINMHTHMHTDRDHPYCYTFTPSCELLV